MEERAFQLPAFLEKEPKLDLRVEELEDMIDPADAGTFWAVFVGGFAAGVALGGIAVAT